MTRIQRVLRTGKKTSPSLRSATIRQIRIIRVPVLFRPQDHFFPRCSILAQVSRRPIVRLNTSRADVESASAQK